MTVEKANWLISGDNVHVVMPFQKVNQEKRTASGFATLNNVDEYDDVVTAECSADAFNRFRGNIREMHQPIAAGRMVNFAQEPYMDTNTGMMYEGIYMAAYVSKGAESTWEKVKDGTLTGFSIGGVVKASHQEYIPELDKTIRFIDEMDLHEVSLVDNPANQMANILSIEKVNGQVIAKGMAADAKTETVFYCPEHKIGRTSTDETAKCREGNHEMSSIGWIEVTADTDIAKELKKSIDDHEKVLTTQTIKDGQAEKNPDQSKEFANESKAGDNKTKTAKSEGGVDMSEIETKAVDVDETTADEVVEKDVVTTDDVKGEDEAKDEKDEADNTLDVNTDSPHPNDVPTAPDEVREELEAGAAAEAEADENSDEGDKVEKSLAEVAEHLATVTKALSSLTSVVTEVKEKQDALESTTKALATEVNESLETADERLDEVEKSTAGKKSGEADEEVKPVKKGFSWDGHFATARSLVDN